MNTIIVVIVIFLLQLNYLTGQIKIHQHLTTKEGLVNDRIEIIEQDKKGYLWIGTDDGLSRWDGNRFLTYQKHNGLSSSQIRDIAVDSNNVIYVATSGGGLNIIRNDEIDIISEDNGLLTNWLLCVSVLSNGDVLIGGEKGSISLLSNGKLSKWIGPEKLNNKDVYEIFESKNGTIYIGTFQGGFFTYNNGQLKNYAVKDGLVNDNVYNFFENSDGSIYLSTNLGVHLFNEGKIEYQNKRWGREATTCRTILKDKNQNTYFATAEGLFIIGKYKHELINKDKGLSFNELRCLFIDDYGTIYIGTYGNGIDIYYPDKIEIFNQSTGLPNEKVWSIYKDMNNDLYLGTHQGLTVISKSGIQSLDMADYNYGNVVKNILKAQDGKLYIGTTYGINILNNGTNKKLTKEDGLIDTYIMDMKETPDGKVLAATRFGVAIIDNGNVTNISKKDGLIDDYILSILVSSDSILYFGTNGQGISFFKDSQLKSITKKNGLSDLTINVMAEDKFGNLYFGTNEGGLNIFKDGKVTVLDINSGLSSNSIRGLAISKDGKVYASTNNGLNIIEFSQAVPKITIVNSESGLPSNLCLDKSLFLDDDGFAWFGTASGLIKYNLKKDFENKVPPKIYITNLKIFNEDELLSDIVESPYLEYDQNYMTFNFTGINLSAPSKLIYQYRLTGVDKNWIESKNNYVQYTNLSSGNYTFEVKAMNESGYWSKPAKISFVINPPFWKTWWAYTIYFILASIGFFLVRRYELNRVKLRNDLKLKEFESQKLQEVDQIKSRFFANISHEFRTPLTIIIGSLEKLKSKMENNSDHKELVVMKRNASRLLHLINQLLELSRLESGNTKLNTAENDIVKFLKRITASFSSLANDKNIQLTFNNHPVDEIQRSEEVLLYYDKKKLETVFYNLLSNAVKFSPAGEKIDVSVAKVDENVKINFANTGTQISPDKIKNIFDRFYQVDDTGTRNFEGTGIGLSLVKEYVELHKGKIGVKSNNNRTIFTIHLPLGKNHLSENEIVHEDLDQLQMDLIPQSDLPTTSTQIVNEQVETDKTIILVVEDNSDLREMIKENLQGKYFVIEAENGVKGLKLAEETIPDLIISDIMMPEMDGYELSQKIKTNDKTNHIPVILLTAKAETKDKLEGFETGADDYLIKPFNSDELIIRVKNLIKIRRQLREKYQSQMLVKPADVVVPSIQKVFLDKLTSIIEKNISNDNFSVEILCDEIGMSRAQLHRKIKALTNQSASEFIRNFRLQRASELLKQNAGNIAEISYQVGFNSQAYFTKMFQELYGQTPLEFKKQHSK